jgi:DNA-binding CsgD family transcriptional regulator
MGEGGQEATLYKLRRTVLDAQRGVVPPSMLDCGAHMLLYFDEPSVMKRIGLQHLLERFGATRGDIGLGSAYDPIYRPSAVETHADYDVPNILGVAHPNRDRAIQSVWQSNHPIYFDVVYDPIMNRLLPAMKRFRTRAKMTRRLEYRNRSFGLICIDHTEERRRWNRGDLLYLDQFVLNFLSPIVAASRFSQAEGHRALTEAERAVVRLAAQGLSYKEIAAALHKSPYTVDNQLRRIRERLGVHNKIELVRACSALL